ncbi:MAG: TlpA family protein disulfide reductase [Verrucomicrobia bacterium]|nr:TlpA family protein disulfide reductase [Verrucomicrobiota bacterium]
MYPHERSLVKRLEGRPFVLLGVNSDPKERLRKVLEQENITWRSWWDGGSTGGPIAQAWGIRGWPTLFLIDHKGVIRHQHLGSPGGEVLDEELEKLIAEAEAAKE